MPVLKIKNNGVWEQVGGIPDHTHVVDDITDFPTSLPANGGNADTVDGKHASDFASAAEMTTVQNDINDINTVLNGIDIPTALPNPNTLTFTGAVEGTYDGSSPVTVNIPSVLVVRMLNNNGTWSADKTYKEIKEAFLNGTAIYALTPDGYQYPLSFIDEVNAFRFEQTNTDGFLIIDEFFDVSEDNYISHYYQEIDKLPNPKAITFTGAVNTSYDGSSEMSVEIPDVSGKMDKNNPTGTGSFSLNRKSGTTIGKYSHAEGLNTTASGAYSHAEGERTVASAAYSHAEGGSTKALNNFAHAEGSSTTASGFNSHAEGNFTTASGQGSHAEGSSTQAASIFQHVQGKYNIVDSSNVYADIIGNGRDGSPSNAATIDWSGNAWYAGDVYVGSTSGTNKDEGSKKLATEDSISGKMDKNNPTGTGSFSLNRKSGSTIGTGSHTEGYSATASGDYSHAEGYSATASGNYSHVEGFLSKALGEGSHAEGHDTEASGDYSHAEGYGAIASGEYAHAEGFAAKALGKYSHAEGDTTRASGNDSHAEGTGTTASGESSHAEGAWTTVSGEGAHAEGSWTKASSSNQHVQGKYNIEDSSNVYADIIGNGTLSSKSNASTVDWHGNAWYAGDVYVGSTSGTNKDEGSKKLATEEYVNNSAANIDIPTTLPNPQSLTFTGATEGTYDGSTSLNVNIPSALADLTTDSAHRLVTDTEKSTWNAKAEVSAIPTKVSQLTNDSGYLTSAPVTSVNGKTGAVTLTIPSKTSDITNDSDFATNSDVTTGISTHNSSTEAHNDIRLLVQELANKLNTLADSDDTTLDQLSEIVTYIKNNKSLIDGITTSKVSVSDIIDNLTTSVTNKPLSAKQGVALKALIDAIVVPTKLPNPNAITFTGAAEGTYDGSSALTVDIPSAPEIPTTLPNPRSLTFTGGVNASYDGSSEVSVEIPDALSDLSEDATHRVVTDAEKAKWNAKSNFSGSYNDLTDKPTIPDVPVQSVNGKTGAVVLSAEDVGALPGSTVIPEALPNPNAITFTGAVEGTYDGSNPMTVEIPSAPTVPENISAFKNDVGYLTKHQDISGKIDNPASGVVGQVLAVKTVDENGKPTEFDCVNQTGGVTIPIVDSVDEMVDTSKQYILKSTGTIWAYKSSATEQEVTVTDELDDTTYYDNSRLASSATGLTDGFHNDATGYHITPLIDLTKAEYQGKTIQIHFEGAKYITSATETWIQHRYYKTDGSVLYARGYSSPSDSGSVGAWKNATITINSETSATIEIAMPLLCGAANVQCGYLRFCGKGAVAGSHIYITYKETQTVISEQWVDTGIQYGGGGLDAETAAKISALNNEGNSPSTIKLLPKPVLDFYNAAAYSDSDYSYSHLEKITYPCRADIPVPYTVKWNYNESAMRTTVAVDTRAIGTVNAYTLRTYDATGLNKFPIYNLLPNKKYYYKVTHIMSDGSLVEAKSGSFTTSSEPWRLLYIDGTQNVRDLGGWTGLNGKKVKYGKIIRGAALSDSSSANMIVTGKGRLALGELKIQAELNLGAIDNATSIAANCAYKKIGYTNYAIAITGEAYRAQFKEVLEWIVSCLDGTLNVSGLYQVQRNIYMHCQGGCDRTGTLSFQLLGLLGVSESDLAKEYELSSFSDVGFGRLRTTTKAVDTYDYVGMVEALKTYSGDTITDKFVSFALDCGISNDTITRFRNLMLE